MFYSSLRSIAWPIAWPLAYPDLQEEVLAEAPPWLGPPLPQAADLLLEPVEHLVEGLQVEGAELGEERHQGLGRPRLPRLAGVHQGHAPAHHLHHCSTVHWSYHLHHNYILL